MKQKKSKKQDKRTLASVVKEMAQPRFAKSARTGEEKTPGDDKAKAFVGQNVSEEVGCSRPERTTAEGNRVGNKIVLAVAERNTP